MQILALTREQFTDKSWRRTAGYAHAARSHILSVAIAELVKLVPAMPLAFIKVEETFQLVAITSLQPQSNCFVAPDGNWIGDYVPAAVRAYPFSLIKPQDREDKVLCFDSNSGLLGEAGQGAAFFDGDSPSKAVAEVMQLLTEMENSRVQTQRAVDALQAVSVIQPWPLALQQGEQKIAVEGLYRIDEAMFNALPDDAYPPLQSTGALALAYGQLFSMNQLAMLPKAADVGARIKAQLEARAKQSVGDLGFRFAEGETLKFS